ncbi:MAG: hypothetical protein Q9162_002822 [Coniocarpon cinnabarinum]
MSRPLPPPNASADTGLSTASPSQSSKPAPASATHARHASGGVTVNGAPSRSKPRQRPSQPKLHDKHLEVEQSSQKLKEPYVKDAAYILRKFRGKPPSLILHLHPTYFRFDQQDGTFSYNSEMRIIIENLKARTVPHDLIEELLQASVTFYDGCLIVEVHDHKASTSENRDSSIKSGDLGVAKPFSLHDNTNRFITPSPYAPIPIDRDPASRPTSSKENNPLVSGSMPAPEKPAKKASKPRVFTVVLHPTELTRHREISLLTRTPMVDPKGGNRRQTSASGRERPTPLSAIPPTPTSASAPTPYASKGAKRQRMCLEEGDVHYFEGEILKAQYPSLLLEPARDFAESQAMMDLLRDPLHDQRPIHKQTRKRTTAELAADEAQATEEERIALIMDERIKPSLVGDGKVQDFQPDWSRFKKLEDIRRNHEEEEKRKKQEEAVLQHNKTQQQRSDEDKRRQSQEMNARQEHQLRQQRALEAQKAAAQRQAQMQQQQAQAQSPMQNPLMQQMMQQQGASQAPHMSPVPGTQPPQNGSPFAGNVFTNSLPGTTMAPTSSTQGPGSPSRPGSAMPAPSGMAPPMGRQVSQQTSQANMSRNSTPQMPNATPQMRTMTPQPQQHQMPNGVQQTPIMGQQQLRTPQAGAQQMQQFQQMTAQLQAQMLAARQSGNPQQMAHVQHLAARHQDFLRRHQQQQQQMQGQAGQNTGQMQASPAASHYSGQMSPQTNGVSQSHGQAQMTPNMPPQQQQQHQNAQLAQQRVQEYKRSLAQAQAAQNHINAASQGNAQGRPHSPPQSMPQQFGGPMSTAGSPNGMTVGTTMNRNNAQFPNGVGHVQSPNGQMQINQMGQPGQQQQRPPNPQQMNPQQMRTLFFQRLIQGNNGQLPPDAEHRWQQFMRTKQQANVAQRAQQLAGQPGAGMMMPGQGLQNMQQAGVRPPGQMQNMQNLQGMNAFQQQQQHAAMMKLQQQQQHQQRLAMQQQQQNQQQQNMMNGMGGMNNGMNNGMNGAMGRPG